MTYLLDTHALVWFLEADPRLGQSAKSVLGSPDSVLFIPIIVLAEIQYLYARKRIPTSLEAVRRAIETGGNCEIVPLDERIVERLPVQLNMHDAIIVATGLHLKEQLGDEVVLVTKDQQIRDANLLPTLW